MKYREHYVGKLASWGQWQVLLWFRWPPTIKRGVWPTRSFTVSPVTIMRYWIVGPIEVRRFLV